MKFSLYPACLMFRGRLRKNFLAPARTAGDVGHPRTEQETLHCRRPKKLESAKGPGDEANRKPCKPKARRGRALGNATTKAIHVIGKS